MGGRFLHMDVSINLGYNIIYNYYKGLFHGKDCFKTFCLTISPHRLSLSLYIYIYIHDQQYNMIVGLFGGLSKQWKCNDKFENICHNNVLRMVFQGHCEDVIQAQVRLSEWDSFTGTSYCFQWEVTLALHISDMTGFEPSIYVWDGLRRVTKETSCLGNFEVQCLSDR